jgi:glutathione S-transferase
MYKIIGSPKTRAFRVMWMLHELGEPYELDPVPPRDPRLDAINPTRKVPILRDGSNYVIDSVAICQYLADKHGRLTHKAGTIARAHQDSFTQFAVDDLELPLWVHAKHTFAIPEEYRVPDVKRACLFDFGRALDALSIRLGTRTNVTGDQFTVPDLLLGHLGGWAKSVGFPIPEGNVLAYIERVRSRPAFLAAMAEREKTS